MDILKQFNEIEKRAQAAISEQPKLEAERNLVKKEVAKKIQELKELGITFENKDELLKIYKETEDNLELSLQSLKRKLDEYDNLKQELNEIENTNNNDMGVIY